MLRPRTILVASMTLLASAGVLSVTPGSRAAAEDIPGRISDAAFWQMVSDLSEPGGYFRSDNFLSNETAFQSVIPELKKNAATVSAYLGVGPEQNFTYVVALKPKIAFIIDIRRQNMLEHLLYKAVIELSADRADLLSRLFSRKRPSGLGTGSTAEALFQAYSDAAPSETVFKGNLRAVLDHLTKRHGFKLMPEDEKSIEYVYSAFYGGGPDLNYSFQPGGVGRGFGRGRMPTYADLMVATDGEGEHRSYLASEENFRILKDLEEKNLIVPVVGNFAGDKALRAVGGYLKEHGSTVTAFYTSNVEQYLFQQGDDWKKFLSNVATLPVNGTSTFIRSVSNNMRYQSPARSARAATLLCPIADLVKAFTEGKIQTYFDVIGRSK